MLALGHGHENPQLFKRHGTARSLFDVRRAAEDRAFVGCVDFSRTVLAIMDNLRGFDNVGKRLAATPVGLALALV
jgi:hypothetical protein